jgi:hypothetical protein
MKTSIKEKKKYGAQTIIFSPYTEWLTSKVVKMVISIITVVYIINNWSDLGVKLVNKKEG